MVKPYLTRGKRDLMRHEYQAEINRWAIKLGITTPLIVVRHRVGGKYRRGTGRIFVPPEANRELLIHEFAHHLSPVKGHGPRYRIALIQAITVACPKGDLGLYPWHLEYHTIAAWARRHGLTA